MPKRKRLVRRKPADLWIQRFPWCRGVTDIEPLYGPPGCGIQGSFGYPYIFKHLHVIVDHDRFVKFLQHAWELEVDESDLNVLEYFGLVMPIRKAVAESLRLPRAEMPAEFGVDRHTPVLKWLHARWCYSGRQVPKAERSESAFDIDMDYPKSLVETDLYMLRPTPFLWSGYDSMYFPRPQAHELPNDHPRKETAFPRRIPPAHEGKFFSAASLERRGLWYRPMQPAYWALLGSDLRYPKDLSARCAGWIGRAFHGQEVNSLQLDSRTAYFGQRRATRFYVIGLGDRSGNGRNRSKGQFGCRFGQDWVVNTLIRRMHHRTGLSLALELEHAFRPGRVNSKKQILATVAAHWKRMGDTDIAPVPPLIPNFHRNAMLWLLHQNRGDVARDRAYRDLGRLVGLKPDSVHQACAAGRSALMVK